MTLPDEGEICATLTHWVELAAELLSPENSHRWMRHHYKQLIYAGGAPNVLEWAYGGDVDADQALREVYTECTACYRLPPLHVVVYMSRPPITRGRGRNAAEHFLRDGALAVIIKLAAERWPQLRVSRNHISKQPKLSICYLLSRVVDKRITSERRLEKICTEYKLTPALCELQSELAAIIRKSQPATPDFTASKVTTGHDHSLSG
jgi:hypothetical protein